MLIAFILLYIVFLLHTNGKKTNAIGKAIIYWNIFSFILVEIASLFYILERRTLVCIWGMVNILLIGYLVLYCRNKKIHIFNFLKKEHQINKFNFLFLIFGVAMILFAIATVPYNWDSMTYHLSRIFYWTQNKSIAHFATNNIRQITSPALASIINVQVYILTGKSDVFLNLLQCASYLLNGFFVYKISKKIGCKKKYCILSTVIFFSAPIAFAEALTTQVDNFATLWLVIFTYKIIDFLNENKKLECNKKNTIEVIELGICIAFAYLTKPNALIPMLCFAIGLLYVCIKRKDKLVVIIKYILLVIPMICLLIIPEIARNIITFGSISNDIAGERQLVGTCNPAYLFLSFLKNFSFNLNNRYISKMDEVILRFVNKTGEILNVNINDYSIAEDGRTFALNAANNVGHDTAINFTVVFLAAIAFMICLFSLRKKKGIDQIYSLIAGISFLFFCMILRWQPFITRYMICFFSIMCPMIGIQFQSLLEGIGKRKRIGILIGISFLVCMDFYKVSSQHLQIAQNMTKRANAYFTNRRNIEESYIQMIEILNEESATLGLIMGEDSYEYPLLQLTKEKIYEVKHIQPTADSARYLDLEFVPTYIVTEGNRDDILFYENAEYERIYLNEENILSLYKIRKSINQS